ncbi:hypothetical protein PCANC_19835 [Puccinia coronata f. sp. avenae]|uniref:Uncharacterized protein n=1 Tax=Puccinia coronata f. sp. avenae TaxID=200324 RepID=A0A2N5UA09_9BASI|nr:hypothetical protein PCANC_19835 [Puccinia coronata f. sp. avenae]
MVRAKPAFQGWAENHLAAANLHSSQGGLEDVVGQAALMSRKRPPEDQPVLHQPVLHQLVSSGFSNHWTDYGLSGDFQEANPGHGMMPDVAKRQRTVQDGYGADYFPEFQDSDALSLTGPTHQPMFLPTQSKDHEFEEFASFPSVSASHDPLLPYPSHDAPYHGSLDVPREHSNFLSQETMFQSMSSHQAQTPDNDHNHSQLLADLLSSGLLEYDDLPWPSLSYDDNQAHPSLPVPESIAGINQGHGLQESSPFLKHSYDSQDASQPLAQNQIYSHQPFDGHMYQIHDQDSTDHVPSSPRLMTLARSTANSVDDLLTLNHGASSRETTNEAQFNVKQVAHILNQSAEDDSGRDKPVHESMSLDVRLSLQELTFPRRAISKKALGALAKQFRDAVSGNFDPKFGRVKLRSHPLADLFPVYVFKLPHSGQYQIRVASDPTRHTGARGKPRENIAPKLSEQFTHLIKWLLLINTACYRKLNPTDQAMSHAELNSNNALKEWLFKETFKPERGLPVLGTVESQPFRALEATKFKEPFGPTQQELLTFLSSPNSNGAKEATPTAVSIIILHFKHTNPKALDELGRTPVAFYPLVKDATGPRAVKIGSPSTDDPDGEKLGDFQIRTLKVFPKVLMPGVPRISAQYNSDVKRGISEAEF